MPEHRKNSSASLLLRSVLAAAALVLPACGTRVSDSEIVTAAGARTGASEVSGEQPADPLAGGDAATTGEAGDAPEAPAADGAEPGAGDAAAPEAGASQAVQPGSGGTAKREGAAGRTPAGSGGTAKAPAAGSAPKAAASGAPTGSSGGKKSPITVGIVGTFSGPVGALVKDQTLGARVWAQYVNERGGVNGHQVNVVVGDDGGDPARFNSLVQQFVEKDGAIAFLYTTLGFAPAGNNSYLDRKKIFTFGTEGGLDTAYTNPFVLAPFAVGQTNAKGILFSFAKVAVPQKKVKLASYACSDFALCDNYDRQWTDPAVLKATGFKVVERGRPSLTQPDYTSQCLSSQQAGAQAIIIALDTAAIRRFAADCARQNYRPLFATAEALALPTLAADRNVDGMTIGTKVAPFVNEAVPGIKAMRASMKKFAPSAGITGGHAIGFTIGSFFGAAAANLPDKPTPADVQAGLYRIKNNDLDGLTYPLTFTAGKPSPNKLCYGVVVIKDKAYRAGPGPALNCA